MTWTPNPRNVIGTIYDTGWFQHDANEKLFVSEMSSTREVLRQLWNDSMDLGFGLKSRKTGDIVYFTFKDIIRDDEGDIVYWLFEPFRAPEALKGYFVRIYNT